MTTTADTPSRATPWHLWVVGGVALLWNGFGGYDYWMSQTVGDAYFHSMGMSDAQIAGFKSMPIWMVCVWAVGVWGAVLASLLLLARRRWAYPTFVVSLAAFLLSVVYWFMLSGQAAMRTQMTMVMDAVIGVSLALFALYSRAMAKRGVLR
jgi:hypothetical protein